MYLLVDNYDSFTWNVYHSIANLGAKVIVKRNDKLNLKKISINSFKGIIFSPGPGHPKDSLHMLKIIDKFKIKIPLLGICLGHQALALSFGGNIAKMKQVMHGKTDDISIIKKDKIFKNFPEHFTATRYHSLEVVNKKLPSNIEVLATSKNKTIMALKIKKYNIYGVQFHPESISSQYGNTLFENFIKLCEKKK